MKSKRASVLGYGGNREIRFFVACLDKEMAPYRGHFSFGLTEGQGVGGGVTTGITAALRAAAAALASAAA